MSAPSDKGADIKEEKMGNGECGPAAPDDPCPVCLTNRFNESSIDGCTHTFCYSCISEWLKVSESCPLCKAPVTEVRTKVDGQPLIKKLTELKAEAEAARIMAQANEVPMTSEREAVSALIHQQRATVQNIIADKARNKKNRQANEIYKRETSQLTQLMALKEEMERLPRRDIMGDSRFRRVVYEQQLLWKPITRPSTETRFSCAAACADPDRLMQRLAPFLTRELKIVMDPKNKPSERVMKLVLTTMQNHEINNPNFELALFNTRLFKPWCIGIFSRLLYEFCASGLELEAFDANSSYSLDPARAPSGRLIPSLLPPSSQSNEAAIFLDEDEEGEDDDSVIIDRAHRSDSSSSDGVTGLYNHRACRFRPPRNPLLPSNRPATLRERLGTFVPSFTVPTLGGFSYGRELPLFPAQSTSRRIQDPEVISLEDEPAAGDEARINSIHRRELDSSLPSWLRNVTDGGGPSTSGSFGSRLNPLSRNDTDGTNREECSRIANVPNEGRGIETSWRAVKEKKEESRREKRRHEEKKNDLLGTRVGSRKNSAEYYFNKIMRGNLDINELQRMSSELTTFANRIDYLKEECNKKLAEKRRATEHSSNGYSHQSGGEMDDDVIHVEEQSGPSRARDDSVILCDL